MPLDYVEAQNYGQVPGWRYRAGAGEELLILGVKKSIYVADTSFTLSHI